jgi:hypothetical protein
VVSAASAVSAESVEWASPVEWVVSAESVEWAGPVEWVVSAE